MKEENTIKNELESISKTVANIPATNPFAVEIPSEYFDQLAGQIISKIQQEENEALPDSLKSVRHINVYEVNENYFTLLDEKIKEQIKVEAKIVPIKRRNVFVKYLAAAAITGILGFSLVNFYINYKEKSVLQAENELAIKEAKKILTTGTFNNELNTLNEDDISSYLATNGNDVHAALVAASLDEQTLPEEEEYMYNDNTLDNFLKGLNISDKQKNNN